MILKNNWTKTIFWSAVDKRGEAWVRIKGNRGHTMLERLVGTSILIQSSKAPKGTQRPIRCPQWNRLVEFCNQVAWADCFPPGLLCSSPKSMHSAVWTCPSTVTAGIVFYHWGWGFFHILSLIWTSAPLSSKYLIQSSHILPRKAKILWLFHTCEKIHSDYSLSLAFLISLPSQLPSPMSSLPGFTPFGLILWPI